MTASPPYHWFPEGLPTELLALDPLPLLRQLGRPALVRVPGGDKPPRVIACLLHGDESTGLEAVLHLLRRERAYPFDLYVLIGNVRAAVEPPGFAHRYLDDQEDFNRIWGLGADGGELRAAAHGILERLRDAGVAALVDVHNNSGNNPFYAIVTREEPRDLNLATLFTTTLLRWDLRANTLMEALPGAAAIAVECGLPGRPESLAFAIDGLRRFVGEAELVASRIVRDFDMLGGLRKVLVRPKVRFAFGDAGATREIDFVVSRDADLVNFVEVDAGHVIGHVRNGTPLPLQALDARGHDVTDEFFALEDDLVVTRCPVTPVMMTRTVAAARKDCLFYVSVELPPPTL